MLISCSSKEESRDGDYGYNNEDHEVIVVIDGDKAAIGLNGFYVGQAQGQMMLTLTENPITIKGFFGTVDAFECSLSKYSGEAAYFFDGKVMHLYIQGTTENLPGADKGFIPLKKVK